MGVLRIASMALARADVSGREATSDVGVAVPEPGSVKPSANREEYLDRILKLIPGEIIGGYTAARTYFLAPDGALVPAGDRIWLTWVLPVFFSLVLLGFRSINTLPDGMKLTSDWWRHAQWTNVGLSLGAFIIWALSLGDQVFSIAIDPKASGALIVLYAVLIWFFAQVSSRL